MSRIGKLPISIPAGVTVTQAQDGVVTVKGPKGELSQKVDPSIKMTIADGHVSFEIDENSPVNIKQKQAFHGLYRALINNMVVGVSEGYKKEMELIGVGYRVSNQATSLSSHSVILTPFSFNSLRRLRWRLRWSVTRTHRLFWSLATSSCLDSFVLRFVLSVCRSLTRVRVSCSRARLSVVSRVSQPLLSNNHLKYRRL